MSYFLAISSARSRFRPQMAALMPLWARTPIRADAKEGVDGATLARFGRASKMAEREVLSAAARQDHDGDLTLGLALKLHNPRGFLRALVLEALMLLPCGDNGFRLPALAAQLDRHLR